MHGCLWAKVSLTSTASSTLHTYWQLITSFCKNTNSARITGAVCLNIYYPPFPVSYAEVFAFAALPAVFFVARPVALLPGLAAVAAIFVAVLVALQLAVPVVVAVFVAVLAGVRLVAPVVVVFFAVVLAAVAAGQLLLFAVLAAVVAHVAAVPPNAVAGLLLLVLPAVAVVLLLAVPAGVLVRQLVVFVVMQGLLPVAVVVPLSFPGRYYFVQAVLQQVPYADAFPVC